MATTEYGVNDALAVKLWAKKLFVDALKTCYVSKFIGKGSNSMIQLLGDTQKSAGDKITVGLRMQLSGDGVSGDGTLEGNEEALTTYSDAVYIDQLRHAVRSAGKMSEQRVPFSVRDEARAGLVDWWADRIDQWFFNQVCGYTIQTDTRYTGMQATVAPSSGNQVWPDASTDDASLSSDVFTIQTLDKAVEKAKTATNKIRPIRIGGGDFYVAFLHPYQVYDLRSASAAAGTWFDIQKAALSASNDTKNPIFTGALGLYNGVVLHESTRVTQGVAVAGTVVTGVRRAVLCGAQAAVMAYGQDSGSEMSWVEELFDYNNQLGVSAGMIAGLKKTRFNSLDFGTVVMSSTAAAH